MLWQLCFGLQLFLTFDPGRGRHVLDLAVGHIGQAVQNIAQVSEGILVAAPATLDEGVNDGAALARIRFPDEEPVFLFMQSFP